MHNAARNITRPLCKGIIAVLGLCVFSQGLSAEPCLVEPTVRAWADEPRPEQSLIQQERLEADNERLTARLAAMESVLAIIDQQATEALAKRDALAVEKLSHQERIASLESDLDLAQALIRELSRSNKQLIDDMEQRQQD